MSFGRDKCSRIISKRGNVITTELPEGTITDVQDSYIYLGIPQANGNHKEAKRKSATTKYLQRVRQVLMSQLNRKNKVRTINTNALSVRYPTGIITWSKKEIEATDNKTS